MSIYKVQKSDKNQAYHQIDNILPDSIIDKVPFLLKKAKEYPEEKLLLLFKAVRKACLGTPDCALCQRLCDTEVGTAMFSMTLLILKSLIRLPASKLTERNVRGSLDEMRLPPKFVDFMVQAVCEPKSFERLDEAAQNAGPNFVKLENLNWEINVGICSSTVGRLLEPTISFTMKLSTDKIVNFEVPLSKFHELRYNVAGILKSLADLEKKPVMKMAD